FNHREKTNPWGMKEILKGHFTHILDSIEKEMSLHPQSTCVLFLSPEEPRIESHIRKALAEIYGLGPSPEYSHIKDSFNFEVSLHSFGSQLADYCAGVFNGCCRFYPQSIDLFRHQVWPRVQKKNKQALGWGITEIPPNPLNRKHTEEILKKVFQTKESDYRVRIENRLKSKQKK
ncbi:hypothetical protein KGY73_09870, partial [bacterium]|nr:hypothetical protein [bacterium]